MRFCLMVRFGIPDRFAKSCPECRKGPTISRAGSGALAGPRHRKRRPRRTALQRWCCRTGLNCRPLPSSHWRFRARRERRSCAGPSLHHRSRRTLRCHPSGLYTFPGLRAWLGIAVGRTGRFPRLWAVRSWPFPVRWASLPRECSTTELRQRISSKATLDIAERASAFNSQMRFRLAHRRPDRKRGRLTRPAAAGTHPLG